MKKLLSLLLIFFLTACSNSGSVFVEEKEYIKPISSGQLIDRLSDDLLNLFPLQNRKDYILKDIGMSVPDLSLVDYFGNTVDFNRYANKNLIIEVSAYWCTHCAEQTAYNNKIVENGEIDIVQFFIEGDKELIKEFYDNEDVEIPTNIKIIPENDDLRAYFVSSGIEMVPSFYFYKQGKLTYLNVGTFTYERFDQIYDCLFGDKSLNRESLVDNRGNSIFDDYREENDLLNDLSISSKDKLALIDGSVDLTLSIMGKGTNFNKLYDEEPNAIFKIEDYGKYINDEMIVFYIGNIFNNLESDIELINSFKKKHPDINMLTILVDSKDISTSNEYAKLPKKLDTDVVSSNSEIPQIFIDTLINEYPAMLFIENNKMTGGFYNLESLDKMEIAYKVFLGEESIALVKNNK